VVRADDGDANTASVIEAGARRPEFTVEYAAHYGELG